MALIAKNIIIIIIIIIILTSRDVGVAYKSRKYELCSLEAVCLLMMESECVCMGPWRGFKLPTLIMVS